MVCLSETRLNEQSACYVIIPGYILFSSNSATKAGGTAIFVSNTLKCAKLLYLSVQNQYKTDPDEEINQFKP